MKKDTRDEYRAIANMARDKIKAHLVGWTKFEEFVALVNALEALSRCEERAEAMYTASLGGLREIEIEN